MAGFKEVESPNPDQIRLRCENIVEVSGGEADVRCSNIIKKRRDTFLPGLHVAICLVCGNSSTEVETLEGEVVAVTAKDHRSGSL